MPNVTLGSSNNSDDTAAIENAILSAGVGGKITGVTNEVYIARGPRFNQAGQSVFLSMLDNQNRGNGSASVYVDASDITMRKTTVDGGSLNAVGIRVAQSASRFRLAQDSVVKNVRRDWDGVASSSQVSGIEFNGGTGHIVQNATLENIKSNGNFQKATARGIRFIYRDQVPNFEDIICPGVVFKDIETLGGANDAEGIAAQGGGAQGFTYSVPGSILVGGCEFINAGKRAIKHQLGGVKFRSNIVHWTTDSTKRAAAVSHQGALDSESGLNYILVESTYYDHIMNMFGNINGGAATNPDNQINENTLVHIDTGALMNQPIMMQHAYPAPTNSGYRKVFISTASGTSIKNVARCRTDLNWPANNAGQIWDVDATNATVTGSEFYNG